MNSNSIFKTFNSKPPTISIYVEHSNHPNTIIQNKNGENIEFPTFYSSDTIRGKVQIELNSNQSYNHKGIKIELIGLIETYINDSRKINLNNNSNNLISHNENTSNENATFISYSFELCSPGSLNNDISYFNYQFSNIDKIYESYHGKTFSIRYLLVCTINSQFKSQTEETEIIIINPITYNEFSSYKNNSLNLNIGIENLLYVCFSLDRTNYHLKDIMTGTVSFKKLNIDMQMMEIQLVRKEILFGRESEIEIVGNFELLDGSPSSTEDIIPIRLYLRGYRNLSPTIKNSNNFGNNNYNNNNFGGNYNYNFSNDTISDDISVIYYVNLELADNEDRRYFKKMEINLFRLDDEFYRQYRLKNNNGINYLFCRNNSKNNNILESSNKENNGNSSYKKYEEKVEKNEDEDILNSNIMKIRGLFK
jgi:vacuolar protein sorting-associated protein 26